MLCSEARRCTELSAFQVVREAFCDLKKEMQGLKMDADAGLSGEELNRFIKACVGSAWDDG